MILNIGLVSREEKSLKLCCIFDNLTSEIFFDYCKNQYFQVSNNYFHLHYTKKQLVSTYAHQLSD
jgi:hypothetical protein